MSSKLKKKEDQPAIKDFLRTPDKTVHNKVYKGDNKYITPTDSKHKQSPPSDNKPLKKLNLDTDSCELDLEHNIKENQTEEDTLELPIEMSTNNKDKPSKPLTE